jgi:mono/diheme cytochrome c family protein
MKGAFILGASVAAAALCAVASARAPQPYKLPTATEIVLPKGEGAELTAATCAACHSLDYVTSQPSGKGAQFWRDSVTKMINVYGAPIGKEDADTIGSYLAATYGKPAH